MAKRELQDKPLDWRWRIADHKCDVWWRRERAGHDCDI
jgi:hypothetical protein